MRVIFDHFSSISLLTILYCTLLPLHNPLLQVYKGTLQTEEGKPPVTVAVKLIHPHVKARVNEDMDILRSLAYVLELIPRIEYLSLVDAVEQFAQASMMNGYISPVHLLL